MILEDLQLEIVTLKQELKNLQKQVTNFEFGGSKYAEALRLTLSSLTANRIQTSNSPGKGIKILPLGISSIASDVIEFWTPTGDSVLMYLSNNNELNIEGGDIFVSGSLDAFALGVQDGVTAPATISGKAFIYVDTADGDLKVKFGDGTVKTIATDT